MFHYLGLALVIVSWLGGAYILTKWHDKDLATISKHAASSQQSLVIFAGILAGFGSLFFVWLLRWYIPHLHLGTTFKNILTITIALQVVTGLVPDRPGWTSIVHRAAAYSMAALFLPLTWLMVTVPGLSAASLVVCTICVTYMITASITFLLGKGRSHYLIFQTLYILAFQLIILATAYLT